MKACTVALEKVYWSLLAHIDLIVFVKGNLKVTNYKNHTSCQITVGCLQHQNLAVFYLFDPK